MSTTSMAMEADISADFIYYKQKRLSISGEVGANTSPADFMEDEN